MSPRCIARSRKRMHKTDKWTNGRIAKIALKKKKKGKVALYEMMTAVGLIGCQCSRMQKSSVVFN